MSGLKIHPHHGRTEDALRTDLAILSFLREEILSGRFGFVSLQDAYEQGKFSGVECDWGGFRKRTFYQVGLGYADIHPVISSTQDTGGILVEDGPASGWRDIPIPPVRLSPAGFSHITELECALERYDGLNRYITPWKNMFWDMKKYRWTLVISVTGALMLMAIIFGVPTSTLVANIPLVGSVIDTKVAARFDTAREQDGFYRALVSGVDRWSISRSEVLPLSESERIFRITFDDGRIREIYVRKERDSYHVNVLRDAP